MRQIGPWWVCSALLLAAALRLPALALRPMHADEAVHAVKLGQFLEGKPYEYDPNDYHGPILNYVTAIAAMTRGQRSLASLDERTIRLVVAISGIAIVLAPLGLADRLGRFATIMAMLLTAASPAFAYYSRYFLHEPVLVLLSIWLIISLWRYIQSPSVVLAGLTGLLAGLLIATKETWVIVFAAIAAGCLAAAKGTLCRRHVLRWLTIGVVVCLVVAGLLLTSLLRNPKAILDIVKAMGCYLCRAHTGPHIHPWYYYLDLLTWIPLIARPTWNEDLVVIGGIAGIVLLLLRRPRSCDIRLARFLCVYTAVMVVVYCAIPYKTPWCMLGMLHGLILVAAMAIAELLHAIQRRSWRLVATFAVALLGIAIPSFQAYMLCFRLYCDPSNPYVYAHTTKDIPALASRIDQIAASTGKGGQIYIQVICPPADYWPLPWYLRSYPNTGYWPAVDFNYPPGDIILASPAAQADLLDLLYESRPEGSRDMYLMLMDRALYLRPGVCIDAYIRKDIYDASRNDKTAEIYDRNGPAAQQR